jgi:hypothetical protein
MIAGSILFLFLIAAAVPGFMIMKGKGNVSLSWHINLAVLPSTLRSFLVFLLWPGSLGGRTWMHVIIRR